MTVARNSQRDRVLRALVARGAYGLTQVDFLAPDVVDGDEPITRLGARIEELRKAGHRIEKAGRRNRCAVYVLAGGSPPSLRPVERAKRRVESSPEQPVPALFAEDVGAGRPPNPYEHEG